jgi:hypothetical protein
MQMDFGVPKCRGSAFGAARVHKPKSLRKIPQSARLTAAPRLIGKLVGQLGSRNWYWDVIVLRAGYAVPRRSRMIHRVLFILKAD